MRKSKLIITLMMWLLVVLPCFSSGSVIASDIPDARLIGIEIVEMDSENIKVIITTDIPVEYKYFKLNKPPLVAVNLPTTIHAGPARNLFIAKGMVKRVRSSQNRVEPDNVTRVVVHLVSENTPYKVTKVENQIIIETGPDAKKPKREKVAQEVKKTTSTEEKIAKEKVIEPSPSVRAEEKVPAASQPDSVVEASDIPDARLIGIEIVEMDSENIKVIITTDIPVEYKYFKLNKPPLVAVNLPTTIHTGPARNLVVNKGMVKRVRSSQNRVEPDKVTRVVIDLVSEDAPYKVTKVENQIIIATGPDAKKPKKEEVAYKGERAAPTVKVIKEKIIEPSPLIGAKEKVPAASQPEEVIVEETAEKVGVITSIAVPPSKQTQAYRLGPDDVLEITVYREAELNRKVRVSADGYISFPLLGKVKAKGFTVSELENSLTKGLKTYLKNPQVTIFTAEYSTITVTGQVKKPNSYPLKGALTVIEAIGIAGGFSSTAAQNEVKVMRNDKGKQKTILVKVADINENGDKSRDILLKRGDIVFVPESTITITGQVKKPNSYPLKEGLTVIEAIGMAGGFTKYASRNNVKILRIENNKKKTIKVKVADINEEGDKTLDVTLRRNDVVFVPESLF